jgi:hypothetical protein
MVCPLCAHTVTYFSGQDVDALLAAHCSTDACRSAVKTRTPRCAAPGCRSRLTLSTRLQCSRCNGFTCMQHRFVDDHACRETSRPGAGAAAMLRRPAPTVSSNASHQGSGAVVAEDSSRASCAEGASVDRSPPRRMHEGSSCAESEGNERCPMCGTRVASVGLLIEHCEHAHAATPVRVHS